jgi:hypothetical protein
MGVVGAKIQTVEEIYQLVWAAVANRCPIAASYDGLPRLFCPHMLGRNKEAELCCVINTAEKAKADFSRRVRRPIGAASYWRSSEE